MSALGDKRLAKEYLRKHAPDVPLIPGFAGKSQDPADLVEAAAEIGFPVMLKAAAGGGGKGMRVVRDAQQLQVELASARLEALQSFGHGDCILEKFIEQSKHVEVQIVGDRHGEVVSFFERECSVQRRNQKIIEETPCLFLDARMRSQVASTAVRIVQLLQYEGAGTVEFVFDTAAMKFYFLEVNTRLQVEHPITEEVTGVDLVALQLFVASGGRLQSLPVLQELKQTGHAIECRLCAEDPHRNFLPSHGNIILWRPSNPGRTPSSVVRYETAMQSPCTVPIFFDSMICKIVVWAPTRAEAIERMVMELAKTACMGVKTNQLFLQSCLLHDAFQDLGYTTAFIPRNLSTLLENPYLQNLPEYLPLVPSVYLEKLRRRKLSGRTAFRGVRARFHNQIYGPSSSSSEVISYGSSVSCIIRQSAGAGSDRKRVYVYPIVVSDTKSRATGLPYGQPTALYNDVSQAIRSGDAFKRPADEVSVAKFEPLTGEPTRGDTVALEITVNGKRVKAYVALLYGQGGSERSGQGDHVLVHLPDVGEWVECRRETLLAFCSSQRKLAEEASTPREGAAMIKAPMPCKILSILKSPGDHVEPGDCVMITESMKMELSIYADAAGNFRTRWEEGDAVDEGSVLFSVDSGAEEL